MTSQELSQPLRIVVLASGSGTLLQAIMDHQGAYDVCAVVSDVECYALERARKGGIPACLVPLVDRAHRGQWNRDMRDVVASFQPDMVVSAGFMKILSSVFLEEFSGRIINTHPALLPAFPGAHAVRDALTYGVKVTGSTVHFIDEGVDTGEIIAQEPVVVVPQESEADLHERIKQVERKLIVAVLNSFARGHGQKDK